MFLNPNNRSLLIKLDGPTVNIIQDDNIFPLEKIQSCLPTYENLEHVEVLFIHISFSFFNNLIEFMVASTKIIKLLKSFKKVSELYLSADFNPSLSVLQNLDVILNETQHLPVKVFSFKHSCDYLPNVEYFIKHLALNSNYKLQDVRLTLKLFNNVKGQSAFFSKLMQNLQILIQKNQNHLLNLNLTLVFLQYEDVFEMDYQLFHTILECRSMTNLIFQTNILLNQYMPLPASFNNNQLLHLQNLKELNLEFQNYDPSRLELSKQMYYLCYKTIYSLRLVNAIDQIHQLNIQDLNQQIKVFSFFISKTQHQFDVQDFNSLKQLSSLRNLVHLRVHIEQSSTLSNREYNCLNIAKELLSSLNFIVHFEMKIKGFIDSQNFIRFFNILREKQYLIRLKQMNTSPGLQKLMFNRKSLIQTVNIINKKEYQYKLRSLFRRDVITDMLKFKMDLQN